MNPNTRSVQSSREFPRREFLQLLGAGAVSLGLGSTTPGMGSTAMVPTGRVRPGVKGFCGIFPFGMTPVTADNKLDIDSLVTQVDFCNRRGVHGFVWPQCAGGWTTLSEDERLAGAEAILAAGRGGAAALVMGVQSRHADIQEVERYIAHASMHGADAVISLPPPGVTDGRVLLSYYQRVGRMTDLPLFVQRQNGMSIELLAEIHRTVPTARYLMDEARGGDSPMSTTGIGRRTGHSVAIFSGPGASNMLREMELGFSGHCPDLAFADVHAKAFELWHTGRRSEAFDMVGRVLAFNSLGIANSRDVLISRGVFDPVIRFRTSPSLGANHIQCLDQDAIRNGLNQYLKSHLPL